MKLARTIKVVGLAMIVAVTFTSCVVKRKRPHHHPHPHPRHHIHAVVETGADNINILEITDSNYQG